MKLALITDVHANREALEAVFAHAEGQGCSHFAFLGDLVGYGADPAWVVEQVRARAPVSVACVQGNHDAGTVSGPNASMRPEAKAVVAWTHAQLSPAQLAWLAELPMVEQHGECLFVHANAQAPTSWAYVDGRLEASRSLSSCDAQLVVCGHMHVPMLYHQAAHSGCAEFAPTPEAAIPLARSRRWLAIPGATGQPRDGNPAACYATLALPSLTLTFWRVPYDCETAAAKIRAAGLPEGLAQRLLSGT